jgi:hypothetical protein
MRQVPLQPQQKGGQQPQPWLCTKLDACEKALEFIDCIAGHHCCFKWGPIFVDHAAAVAITEHSDDERGCREMKADLALAIVRGTNISSAYCNSRRLKVSNLYIRATNHGLGGHLARSWKTRARQH